MNNDSKIVIELSADLVAGADAIAKYTGLTRRQVYASLEQRSLPIFKIGGLVCARRSAILDSIEARERQPAPASKKMVR